MQIVWVFIGGGLGSLARYGISIGAGKVFSGHFPLGTFLSNLFACLILGITIYCFKDKLEAHSWIAPFVVTGFCGGFSTFSTWSKETVDLIQQGNMPWAIANIIVSMAVCMGLIFWMKNSY